MTSSRAMRAPGEAGTRQDTRQDPRQDTEPLLISLAGIAALAGVRRPVASMWRSRFRDGSSPFPAAAARAGGRDMFDAEEIAQWLAQTGHGNNPDVVADAAASADGVPVDFAEPAQVAELSALITLRAQSGVTLAAHTPDELAELAAECDPSDAYLRREVQRQCARSAPWADYADRLTDAAYSPQAALKQVRRRAVRAQQAQGSAGALHEAARRLLVALVRGLAQRSQPDRALVRVDAGVEAALLGEVIDLFDTDVDVVWPSSDTARALRRTAACAGLAAGVDLSPTADVAVGRFPVSAGQSTAQVLASIDEFALSLAADEAAVVLAPARVLVDALAGTDASARADVLRTGRVRAMVRLGAGLVTSASREALAVWVFGAAADIPLGDRVVAVADLTGSALSAATIDDLVSDILANLGGPTAARAHAFRFARLQRTSSILARSGALVTDAATRRPTSTLALASTDLPALLDAALAAAGADAPAVTVTVSAADVGHDGMPRIAARPRTVTLGDAVAAGHARVLPGTRIAPGEYGQTGLSVITAADLDRLIRGGDTAGSDARAGDAHAGDPLADLPRIDQLAFAHAHPTAQLTRPGDIVFGTSPAARAWVDDDGSHVVAYPLRVLRITAADPGGLVPALVAVDIRAGAAGPAAWKRWRVRVVDPAQRVPLQAALAAASDTARVLRDRLARLDRLTTILADAVSARAVTLAAAPPADGHVPPIR